MFAFKNHFENQFCEQKSITNTLIGKFVRKLNWARLEAEENGTSTVILLIGIFAVDVPLGS